MTEFFLTGWKSIGRFVGVKCPKALKSYEERFGMPVHRLPGGQPCCIPEEVAIWLTEFGRRQRQLLDKKKKQAKK